MSKKKNKISVNTLEKYCDQLNLSPQEIQMPYGDGETLSFTVKPLLSMDESIRFIEDVVRECIMADDILNLLGMRGSTTLVQMVAEQSFFQAFIAQTGD